MSTPIASGHRHLAIKALRANLFMRQRKLLILFSEIALLVGSYYLSFVLRLDTGFDHPTHLLFLETLPFVLAVKLVIFSEFGLLKGWWRFVGVNDLLNISLASIFSSILIFCSFEFTIEHTSWLSGYPRSVVAIDMALTVLLVGGARFAVRAYTDRARRYDGQRNTLIVGAGRAGTSLARELRHDPNLPYYAIGFVDDDLSKVGLKLNGLKVLGTTNSLSRLIAKHHAECVLIAIPSASGQVVEQIVDKCRASHVEFKTLPSLSERLNHNASVSQLRTLHVEDLLSRQPVRLNLDQIRARVEGRVLLITGAGGSIGKELARQVASFQPRRLLLLDRSENDLFKLGMELSTQYPKLDYVSIIGDVLDVTLLREVFAQHRPHSIFHAAAYKHVPMMERNCFQAVINNIFGTYNVAVVARQYETEDFVMISSDKAVNPTNIMGVTKRIAELIILALQNSHTRFTAVRFGNVLGSNGSVLPIFQKQIAEGGPVTVTHPEAKRYFMTTTEAVQLVLQASTMGNGGDIFVLDMGEPVKIVDLAKRAIRLSGLDPEQDIEIVFTGLRPGEKLFEELKRDGEAMGSTSHEKILVFKGAVPSFSDVSRWLEDLSGLVESRNVHGLLCKLVEIVPEYWPSSEIVGLSEVDRHDQFLGYKLARNRLGVAAQDIA